ncbi:11639_t:CDS:1, partial [Dentiscutata erythropus]
MHLASDICKGSRPKVKNEIPDLFKQLINNCWDTMPTNRPTANALIEIFSNWAMDVNDPGSELYVQIKNNEEFKTQDITSSQSTFEMHSEACYASRLLSIPNFPKLDNLSNLYTQPVHTTLDQ